jgi:twinkle protein
MNAEGFFIDTGASTSGNIKTLCPKCSSTRKNKADRCLSVNIETGVFKCHHCGWAGVADEFKGKPYQKVNKSFSVPKYKDDSGISPRGKRFFTLRRITLEVVKRNRITADNQAIHFPYFRDGKVINIKHRGSKKSFTLEKGAELIFYGYDDISDDVTFIVEGEMDKLAMEVAGFKNAIACPSGSLSKRKDAPISFLDSAMERLSKVKSIVLAGDMDEVGEKMTAELSRRLGPERCKRILWPDGCKDANDVLIKHGIDGIKKAVSDAKDLPIEGLFEVNDFRRKVISLHSDGLSRGVSTGWKSLDSHYTILPGQWTVITGTPGTGKSEFLDALMINLILNHGWKFGVCSMENLPVEFHLAKLLEKLNGMPFFEGPNRRMDKLSVDDGLDILNSHIKFILPETDAFTVNGIISKARAAVERWGINGLIIDPWNELEHNYKSNETKYIGDSLTKLRRFARTTDCHVWIVAHPTKLQKGLDGRYGVATLYDISGSANWFNKADCGISLWRDTSDNSVPVQIHVQKIRFQKQVGRPGMEELRYNPINGRYSDI